MTGIRAFADLHGCMELLSAADSFVDKNFTEVSNSCSQGLILQFEYSLILQLVFILKAEVSVIIVIIIVIFPSDFYIACIVLAVL